MDPLTALQAASAIIATLANLPKAAEVIGQILERDYAGNLRKILEYVRGAGRPVSAEIPLGLLAQVAESARYVDSDELQLLWAELISRAFAGEASDADVRWALSILDHLSPDGAMTIAAALGNRVVLQNMPGLSAAEPLVDQRYQRVKTTLRSLSVRGFFSEVSVNNANEEWWEGQFIAFGSDPDCHFGLVHIGNFFPWGPARLGKDTQATLFELTPMAEQFCDICGVSPLTSYGELDECFLPHNEAFSRLINPKNPSRDAANLPSWFDDLRRLLCGGQ